MKIKYILLVLLSVLFIISVSQIFSIPPYAGDIYGIYKSGYFDELEREFDVIKDSFLSIKMFSKPVYAWIFLEDIKNKYDIDIRVFNNDGIEVRAPGQIRGKINDKVISIINSSNKGIVSEVKGTDFYSAFPLPSQDRCKFCHDSMNNNIIGVLTFQRKYDSHVYFSSERIIIFILISIILIILIFFVVKWDPERKIRELFDKI